MNQVIKITDLHKKQRNKVMFEKSNFHIDHTGSLTCITGEDSKLITSFLYILCGIDKDFFGDYKFKGRDTATFKAYDWEDVHATEMRFITNGLNLRNNFTLYDNLKFSNSAYSRSNIEEVAELFNIHGLLKVKVRKLDRLTAIKAALARVYLSGCKIIVFDDPFDGLSRHDADRLMELFEQLRLCEFTIIFSSPRNEWPELIDYHYDIHGDSTKLMHRNHLNLDYKIQKDGYKKGELKNHYHLYILKNYASNIFIKLPKFFLYSIIVFVSVLFFTSLFSDTIENIESQFFGLDNNAVLVSTQTFDDVTFSFDFKNDDKLYFNQEELDYFDSLKYAIDVIPFNYGLETHVDYNNNTLESNEYYFYNMPIPANAYGYISPTVNGDLFELIYGDVPADKSDEILVSEQDAKEYFGTTDYEDVIGDVVSLDVITTSGEKVTKNYTVSGIYLPHDDHLTTYPIYTAYNDRNGPLSEVLYNHIISSPDKASFPNAVQSSYEVMREAWGTGYSELLIIFGNDELISSEARHLQDIFPQFEVKANYMKLEGEYLATYERTFIKLGLATIVFVSIMAFSSIFLLNGYRYLRSYDFLINYLNGLPHRLNLISVLFDYLINVQVVFGLTILFTHLAINVAFLSEPAAIALEFYQLSAGLWCVYFLAIIVNIPLSLRLAFKVRRLKFKRLL